jgi:hypothetical protein
VHFEATLIVFPFLDRETSQPSLVQYPHGMSESYKIVRYFGSWYRRRETHIFYQFLLVSFHHGNDMLAGMNPKLRSRYSSTTGITLRIRNLLRNIQCLSL